MTAGVTETVGLRLSFEDDASRQLFEILKQYGRLENQVKDTTRALKRQNAASNQLSRVLKGLGVAAGGIITARVIGALGRWVDSSREAAVAAFDLGNRVGATSEEISEFTFAAQQNGIEAKIATAALTALGRRAAALPQNFERWGIATRDVNGELLSSRELLDNVADRVQRATTQAERLAVADETLSEAGRKLVPVLQDGADGLEAFREQARRTGASISTEAASRIKLLDDVITDFNASADRASRVLLTALAPALTAITEQAQRTVKSFSDLEEGAVLDETFIRSLEFLGRDVIPSVILSLSVLNQAFTVFRGGLGGVLSINASVAKAFILVGEAAVKLFAIFERFAGIQDGVFGGFERDLANIQRRLIGFIATEGTLFLNVRKDVADIGTEARRQAAEVIAATNRVAARARQIAAGGGARPSGGSTGDPDVPSITPGGTAAADEARRLELEMLDELQKAELEFQAIKDQAAQKELAFLQRIRDEEFAAAKERVQGAIDTGVAFGRTFGAIISGQRTVAEGFQAIGAIIVEQALQFITAEAAKAAAAAFTSQAGIPIIGPALGAAAAAAALTAVLGFAGTFHDGGVVGPAGRIRLPPDLQRPLGPDERFARVQVGETIVPAGQGGGTAGMTNNTFQITLQTLGNPGRASFARTVETDVIPGIRDAISRGSSLEPRNIRGRFLR